MNILQSMRACFFYLADLLFVVDDQQRHTEQDRAEARDGVVELPGCRHLVRRLQARHEVTQFEAD